MKSYEEASQFAEEHGLVFLETSAKTGEHVEEVICWKCAFRSRRSSPLTLFLKAFMKTAQLIYQSVLDGSVDLSQDGGVSKKSVAVSATPATAKPASGGCC